jgi:tetratricopeptide (TPR) repeat protein
LETAQEALCPICKRPLPQAGGLCRYCGEQPPGGFHVRPFFLVLVLVISALFCALTVLATRAYRSKQQQLGQMWFGRGQAALAAGESQAAVRAFRNALYYSHDDPAYRLRLAEALVTANHIPEARSYLVTLWQDEPSNSTVNLQLARLAAKQGETQAALRYYHGAIYGLWPEGDAAARRRQTRLELIHYLLGLHQTTQADAELLALTPELPRKASAHTEIGQLFLQASDPDRALQEFEQALRLNPRSPAAMRGAGEAAFQLAQYQNATRYLEQALKSGPRDAQAADLLATSRLVLEWNPYARGISSRQRALRMVQAFRRARRRLEHCAAARGIDLAATPAPASQPSARAVAPNATSAAHQPAPNLMARILGKIRPGETAAAPEQPPIIVNLAEMQQLYQQVTQVQPSVRAHRLERDPQFADFVMGLATQIETVTAEQCGAPKGADLALLLLAHQAEER